MKKSYIPPKSNLYVLNIQENIASSIGGGSGGDTMEGLMIIIFSSDTTPCRKYYTGSELAINRVDKVEGVYDGTFMEYFMDMQQQGAPIGCLTSK